MVDVDWDLLNARCVPKHRLCCKLPASATLKCRDLRSFLSAEFFRASLGPAIRPELFRRIANGRDIVEFAKLP